MGNLESLDSFSLNPFKKDQEQKVTKKSKLNNRDQILAQDLYDTHNRISPDTIDEDNYETLGLDNKLPINGYDNGGCPMHYHTKLKIAFMWGWFPSEIESYEKYGKDNGLYYTPPKKSK